MSDAGGTLPTEQAAVARGVTRSVGFQLVAKMAHVALNVVSSVAIIRYLAPAAFGDYVLVGSLVTLFGILCDFGIDKFGIREISIDERSEAEITGTVVVVRLVLSVISFVLVQATLFALDRSATVHVAAAVASGLFVIQALLTLGIAFAVRIEQQFDALSQLLGEVVETAFTLWLIVRGATLVELFTAPVVGGAVAVLLTIAFTRRRYRVRVQFSRARIGPLLRGSFPIAIAGVVGIVLLRLDTLMLAAMRSPRDVGIYGAAYQPLQYVLIANVALVTILLPLLSRYHNSEPDRFLSTYRRGTEAILAFILPVALVLEVAARPGVRIAYSDSYAAAANPLRILAVAMVLLTLTAWEAVVLLAAGYQRVTVRCNAVALGFGVVLHGVLIPFLGPAGAALGTVGISALTVAWLTTLSRRLAGARVDVARVARVVAANAPIAAVLLLLPAVGVAWWIAVLVGVAVYPVSLRACGVLPATWRASIGSARPQVAVR
jgi:O-antigen/teichoic acid export membrane protein